MAALPLLYVHGAGPQQPAPAFKHEADMILFGRDMPTTKVAHYSEVRWPPAGSGPTAAPNRAGKTRRVAAIRGSMAPQVSPTEAADAIVSATLTAPRSRAAAAAAAVPPPTAADVAAARRLVAQLYRRADLVASRSAAPTAGRALGVTFPDPIFRFIVGKLASDVIDYLYGPWTEAMRAPVRQALLRSPRPKVDRRAQPRHGDPLRRAVGAGLRWVPGRPPGHGRQPARDRQRPAAAARRRRPAEPGPETGPGMVQLRRSVRSGRARGDPPRRVRPAQGLRHGHRASTTRRATTTTCRATCRSGSSGRRSPTRRGRGPRCESARRS